MISDEKKIIGCCIAENITQVNKHGICDFKKKTPKFAMLVFSMFPCSFTIIGIACLPVHQQSFIYVLSFKAKLKCMGSKNSKFSMQMLYGHHLLF